MKVLRIVVISVLMLLIACACERLESSQVEMGFFNCCLQAFCTQVNRQRVVLTPASVIAGGAQGGGPGSLGFCTSAGSPLDSWGGKKEGEG